MKSFHVRSSKVLGMDSGGLLYLQPQWGMVTKLQNLLQLEFSPSYGSSQVSLL